MNIFTRIIRVLVLVTCFVAPQAYAEGFRPYEPLNPAKAQALATSPLTITSGKNVFKFTVELAATPEERDIGLMHRAHMDSKHGMIFDFQGEQKVRFWMRNTFIPLDMVFIRSNGRIAAILKNVPPHDETPVGPNEPVQAVLEIVGGVSDLLGLKVGDTVSHAIFKSQPAKP